MVIANERPISQDWSDLLARAREGDAEAFCQVAQECEGRLFRQAVALCREESVAEDLVVETMGHAWKSLARYDGACRFSTWLYSILLHRYLKHVRQVAAQPVPFSRLDAAERRARQKALENLPTPQPEPSEQAVQGELTAQLQLAMAALPDKHRQVILLRFYEGASLADMAVVLDCSLGTVKSRLHHALEKLRRMKTIVNLSNLGRDR
jgi:RNA polymerase sigma-70 factor (ECF subfamily)